MAKRRALILGYTLHDDRQVANTDRWARNICAQLATVDAHHLAQDHSYNSAILVREGGCDRVVVEGCRKVVRESPRSPAMETAVNGLDFAISLLKPGDTFVAISATHVAQRVRDLRRLKDKIESKGATLQILRAGWQENPTWIECEAVIRQVRINRNKAAGRYKAGPGRPPRVDAARVVQLTAAGFSDEAIMAELDCDRSTVFRKRQKAA